MKMKKIVMGLVMALFAMNAMADRILWVGIGDNPQVEVNGVMTPLATWIASLPGDPGGRIRVNGIPMVTGFEDPNQVADPSLIPAGQTTPSIVWETDFEGEHIGPYTDFELSVVDENFNPIPGMYVDWTPIRLDITDSTASVFFDLGYYDDNYDFVSMASTSAVLGDLWSAHTYETGSLAPPIQTPWRPFAAVPEPSTAILALFGTCLLLKRRKTTHA